MLTKLLSLLGLKHKSRGVVFEHKPRNEQEVRVGLTSAIADQAGLAADGIDEDRTFAQLGFDSLQAMKFTGLLEKSLGLDLEPTLMWDHPTIGELTTFLSGRLELDGEARSIA